MFTIDASKAFDRVHLYIYILVTLSKRNWCLCI